MPRAREPLLARRKQAALRRAGASVARTRRAAAAFRLAAWREGAWAGLVWLEGPLDLTLSSARSTSVPEHPVQTYVDLADEPWRCKANTAAETSSMPSVLRFPRKRTNPTRRLTRGLSGRTSILAATTCPAPKDRRGTIDAPSPTATTLFIASTLSNSINGLGGGPASASQSVIVRRSAESSFPRISGQ